MKKLFIAYLILLSGIAKAQNVGVGTTTPFAPLHVFGTSAEKLRLENSNTLNTNITSDLFFKTGTYFTGAIKTIGTGTNVARLGLFTFATSVNASLKERLSITDDGNVGIGTITPTAKLEINGTLKITDGTQGAGKVLTSDAAGLVSWITPAGGGGLPAGVSGNTLRHNGTAFIATSNLYNDGTNIGIGTQAPAYLLDVNGRMRLRDNGPLATAGIWHNKADNTEAAFIGMLNDSTYGYFGNGNWRMGFDVKNSQMGIGTTDPSAPLSFASTTGNKISLWGDALGGHYGLGIQGSLMQLYSSASNADIAFGYGNSSAFTENMRVKGNGNVGIGTNAPVIGGLVVNKVVGNTNAVFGANTAGVSIQSNYPGIGFNTYYNAGSYMISSGGAGYIGVNPTDSKIILSNTGGNASAGAPTYLQDKMWIEYDGTVSLGSSNLNAENVSLGSGYKLKVFGKIISEEVRVQLKAAWPDYVFENNYKKLSITDLEKFVNENKHLPNIPSASEIEKDGQHLGEIQRKMLEKIEEMSLYIIDLQKQITELQKSKK
ncbi:MAG: hypothetical protein ABIT96_05750 [Ferruginibacter sp.]